MSAQPPPVGAFVLAAVVAVVAIGGLVLGTGGSGRSPVAKLPSAASAAGGAQGGDVRVGATAGIWPVAAARQGTSSGSPGRENPERVDPELRQERAGPELRQEGVDPELRQENPEQVDPALRREHDRLLVERPVFQHLPYRDRAIGVGFDRVLPGGALELLVTYVGSRARAVEDLHRLLARYRDPGTAYVERYERVF
jgi:hypothetical protein